MIFLLADYRAELLGCFTDSSLWPRIPVIAGGNHDRTNYMHLQVNTMPPRHGSVTYIVCYIRNKPRVVESD